MPADLKIVITDRIKQLETQGDTAAKMTDRRTARKSADLLRSILAEARGK